LYAINPHIHPNRLHIANISWDGSLFFSEKKFEIKGIPKKPVAIIKINDNVMKKPVAYL
jgi:hypothetical protein